MALYERHGFTKHPIYQCWVNMRKRCNDKKSADYINYGERGIKVSTEWLSSKTFINDMLNTYKKGLTLDRIDNNKGYSKSNCKWSTRKQQACNRRSNRMITLNGITKSLNGWSEYLNINSTTISQRLDSYGWTIQKTLTTRLLR